MQDKIKRIRCANLQNPMLSRIEKSSTFYEGLYRILVLKFVSLVCPWFKLAFVWPCLFHVFGDLLVRTKTKKSQSDCSKITELLT